MDIVLVRHGVTAPNGAGCFIGRTDCGMAEEGFKQAAAVKRFLEGVPFDGIYASPLKRAVQTAEVLGSPFFRDERLAEMNFGIFEGLTYPEIQNQYPEYLHLWNGGYLRYRIPGGESLEAVFIRVEEFIKEIQGNHKRALVISHGGVIRCALSLALSSRDHFYRFRADHGSVSIAAFEADYSYIKAVNLSSKKLDCF